MLGRDIINYKIKWANKMRTIDELPATLRKLIYVWSQPQNWGKTLKSVCEEYGINYSTARNAITRFGHYDFYEIKANLVRRALAQDFDEVLKALKKKAKSGETRAIELYMKAIGAVDNKIKVDLSGNLNIAVEQEILKAKEKAKEIKD